MSKGSRRRPMVVSRETFSRNWDRDFLGDVYFSKYGARDEKEIDEDGDTGLQPANDGHQRGDSQGGV